MAAMSGSRVTRGFGAFGAACWSVMKPVLVVVRGGLLELGIRGIVVLNPQLCPGPDQEGLDRLPSGARLLFAEFGDRQAIERALLWIVIQIPRKHDATSPCEFDVQHLVSGSVARRNSQDDRPIAKD